MTAISQYGTSGEYNAVKAFSYIPCYIDNTIATMLPLSYNGILTFEQCIEAVNAMGTKMGLPQISLDGITEITEEEYYKID